MRIIYALIGLVVGVMPCGAFTLSALNFERDDASGVALRVEGTGLPAGGWELESPSGIWSFPFTRLHAAFDVVHEPDFLAMYFDVALKHRDHPEVMVNRGFNDYFIFGPEPYGSPERPGFLLDGSRVDQLIVRENSFEFPPLAFQEPVFWEAENFLRVDARPRLMDPATWEWTFFTSFGVPQAVPDAGSTLGMLVMALGGLGFMRRAS